VKQETQTLLIHIGGILVIALAVWVSLQIKGTDEAAVGLRVMLIGGAFGLYGKLGFKPASPVLNAIIEKLAQREPERVARLTNQPPPQAASSSAPVAPDGTRISLVPDPDQEPKP
jgi:hypothetical protein